MGSRRMRRLLLGERRECRMGERMGGDGSGDGREGEGFI